MNRSTLSANQAIAPVFWRDGALPFIEARSVKDGRKVCYAKHAHDTFSIGAITGGSSTYLNGTQLQRIGAGAVVVINPEHVHACNPIDERPWSYVMFYVEAAWLGAIQRAHGAGQGNGFRAYSVTMTTQRDLHAGLIRLFGVLTDGGADTLQKETAAFGFFSTLHRALSRHESATPTTHDNPKLARAADYIREHFARALKLEEICAAADLSPSYLIRAFKERYGMTPHAYLVNRRIEFSRAQLRRGRPIAEVAVDAGFADQAHLQRAFRQFTAVTPLQYRR
jgi:AraC-like DNA-binding protein